MRKNKTKKKRRKPVPVAKREFQFRLGRESDLSPISTLWTACGEGNVHSRSDDFVTAAVDGRNLYVIECDGAVIGTGAHYPYCDGRYAELGSSCIAPGFRGFGLADIMLNLRVVTCCLNTPGVVLGAELYPNSVKSRRVLSRWGLEHTLLATIDMHAHAESDAPGVWLAHYTLPPKAIPAHARNLLQFIEGKAIAGGDIGVVPVFNASLRLGEPGMRNAIALLADGELGVAGYAGHEKSSVEDWLASRSPSPLTTREIFLGKGPAEGAPEGVA